LHPDLIEYKGLTKFHPLAVEWLSKFDDGAVIDVGTHPE
jgi:dimethylamine monooxygenase subunit A